MNQDARGIQGHRVARQGYTEIWLRPVTGGHAVALYNLGENETTLQLDLARLGLPRVPRALDLWTHENVKLGRGALDVKLPRHGSAAFRLETESA